MSTIAVMRTEWQAARRLKRPLHRRAAGALKVGARWMLYRILQAAGLAHRREEHHHNYGTWVVFESDYFYLPREER